MIANNNENQSLTKKFEELDADLAITEILNVEEHLALEDSIDHPNYPSSPLLPISASRIYKDMSMDSRKIT